ncbi:uncharacterized protein MYCFIDRAFT_205022 [Pseudocercospora fijiensis CIRAD86]|uniref:Uncharacterized protein n=1 Tax=Pseudocercospora fijiensis (strain CIRAD86) TaxID=383855 RepID=M2ZGY4_PSEFD|nr:uncharacterized protein MYCFIDRAFT_205022 [Pseudocercospora fijiensis CIRAD86]EME78399.1 hypothetical protein MYCFIDRAFT_205022 [Pseudocercospora fijiensis CIRAD86]
MHLLRTYSRLRRRAAQSSFEALGQQGLRAISTPQSAPRAEYQRNATMSRAFICYSYGIDYQNGGSYFIDSRSNASFTCVSQFESCVEDTYSNIILVNDDTGDQVLCTDVPTTPDLVSQMSTCPITKDEMTSGDWSIIVIGNNGDGSPFGWQRDFYLTVGIPQTTTITSTLTFSETTTPVATTTTTSTIQTTTNVPNKSTVTVAAYTRTLTVTPKPVITTTSKIITRTFDSWTRTVSTITKTVYPTCTVPPRPENPDPECRIKPTVIPIPKGLSINISKKSKRADTPLNAEQLRKRFEQLKATRERLALALTRRSPDAPTITETDPVPASTTTTSTAPTSTFTDVSLTTSTATITDPPKTVKKGTKTVTTTLPPKTRTITKIGYTITYKTKTMAKTWTYTTTATAAASVTACLKKGGHFGSVW